MPNLWTHVLFGQRALKELNKEEMLRAPRHQHMFHFGCQGPDFLLYHNFFPWRRDQRVSQLGDILHNEHCGVFLIEMIKYLEILKGERALTDLIVPYALGFLSHYALDRHVHPYVYYLSGYEKWQHQRFEVMMDTIVVKKITGQETWKTPAWKQIYIGKRLPDEIVVMFHKLTNKVYPDRGENIRHEDWHKAYQHMIWAHRLFHDPTGLKRIFTFGQIDPFVYKKNIPTADILNEQKNVWYHPTDREEAFTHSFWDLWELALENTKEIFRHTLSILETDEPSAKDESYTALSACIGNDSYDSGKPCGEGYELKYSESII